MKAFGVEYVYPSVISDLDKSCSGDGDYSWLACRAQHYSYPLSWINRLTAVHLHRSW
jgi:hypothetical protein